MSDKPLVSIIILNYNGERFLEKCLSSVFRTKYPRFEVVLVDNASTDKSLSLIKKFFASTNKLKIVRNSKNLGFGPANNIGFRHAIGDYIVFLNNDVFVDPEWLAALVEAMENDRTIGLAQSMILNMDNQTIQAAGWLIADYFVLLHPIGANEGYGNKFPEVLEVSFASGTAMIIRRELVLDIGLFDPKYFWFYDDTYLSFKTWLVGKRVVTASKSKVYHVGGGTSARGTAGFDTFFIRRHHTICFVSLIFDVYWNLLDLTKALLVFTYNSIITSFKEIIEHKKTTRFWANLSAIGWILKNLKYIWKNRLKYLSKARINQKMLLSKMMRIHIPASIYFVPPPSKMLWSYFKNECARALTLNVKSASSENL